MSIIVTAVMIVVSVFCRAVREVHPIIGHEGPEGNRAIILLFV
jgi:hypothetical protein